jgi:hypothetical protein
MKIVYTESGRRALDEFKEEQIQELVRDLEQRITSRKYVFGDEEVEVTANDVRMAAEMRTIQPQLLRSRLSSTRLILMVYMVLGALTSVAGLFWGTLRTLYADDPIRFMLVVSGVAIALMSYVMLARFRERDREIQRMEDIKRIERVVGRDA